MITLCRQKGVLAIHVPGDLTSASVQEFLQIVETAMPPGTGAPWRIVSLNLAAAKIVDSRGLDLIMKIHKTVQRLGARMQVVYSNQKMHRTLLFIRLDRIAELIRVEPTE
jgi:anti-anti-sigma factor